MGRLGVILGSNALGSAGAAVAAAAKDGGAVVLGRHDAPGGDESGRAGGDAPGAAGYVLPHLIDHEANLRSLAAAGCERLLAIASVGSLRTEIEVGSLVCPDDFIALDQGVTIRRDGSAHATHCFDPAWRAQLLAAWRRSGAGPLRDGGVYWQSRGPRFETPAEIRLIAAHADLVGMTIASECVVAGELGLPYAAVCAVDNMANGIAARPLNVEDVERDRAANAARLAEALAAVLPALTR